ncbi:hypothetical protein LOC67_23075 [Stieleria sp. JC731]|uniref:hypothetical protein n=1 Tax=Pirellulaceae TaxID=2691357 RepID=UPI001E2ADA74|nr:hypothetical protein [Stieleria sp. JC731]MCC9603442.1 hypothetical protein [Stieleria sp. JC731]
MDRRILSLGFVSIVITAIAAPAYAQVAEVVAAADETAESEESSGIAQESKSIVSEGKFYRLINGESASVPLVEKPVLNHLDSERGEQGGVWVVGNQDERPVAIISLWTRRDSTFWVYSVASLSEQNRIEATLGSDIRWAPQPFQLEFHSLTLDAAPSNSAPIRYSQLKRIARLFSGHEYWQDSRHELRILAREMYRYQDPQKGILDGAVFSIAHNTNTECFLLLEAFEKDGKKSWRYALRRNGFAKLHIHFDGKEVWTRPTIGINGNTADPTDAYYLFTLPRKK